MRNGKTAAAIRAIRGEIQSTRAPMTIVGSPPFLQRVRAALDPHEIERVIFECSHAWAPAPTGDGVELCRWCGRGRKLAWMR